MAITLKLRSGGLEPAPELTFDAPRVVIGRASGSELWLPDPSVSHRHASLRQRGSGYVLVDEGSENGSFCGDVRLSREAPHPLSDGDLLRFGRIWVEIRLGPSAASADARASRELARGLVEHALQLEEAPRGLWLKVSGPGAPELGASLSRERHRHVVGSGADADLRLPDASLPQHCLEITRKRDRVWVTRSLEAPSVRLGEEELAEGQRTAWTPGVSLTLGPFVLVCEDVTAQILERVEREATELLAESEPIDPPDGGGPLASEEDDASNEEEESEPLAEARPSRKAPMAAVRSPSAERPRRIDVVDALIFAFGVCVLGSSLWAIRWLATLGNAV